MQLFTNHWRILHCEAQIQQVFRDHSQSLFCKYIEVLCLSMHIMSSSLARFHHLTGRQVILHYMTSYWRGQLNFLQWFAKIRLQIQSLHTSLELNQFIQPFLISCTFQSWMRHNPEVKQVDPAICLISYFTAYFSLPALSFLQLISSWFFSSSSLFQTSLRMLADWTSPRGIMHFYNLQYLSLHLQTFLDNRSHLKFYRYRDSRNFRHKW